MIPSETTPTLGAHTGVAIEGPVASFQNMKSKLTHLSQLPTVFSS